MPQRTATIEGLPMAFEVVKEMQADGLEWGEGYRPLANRYKALMLDGVVLARKTGACLRNGLDAFAGVSARLGKNR